MAGRRSVPVIGPKDDLSASGGGGKQCGFPPPGGATRGHVSLAG